MLPTFVIGLREGLEAALIVGIIAAFLRKNGQQRHLWALWTGVAIAVTLCLAIGLGLHAAEQSLPQKQQEGLETVIGLIAVAFVSWMIIWMRRNAHRLKGDIEAHASLALATGSTRALILMAFLAVLREGFETAVFLVAAFSAASAPLSAGIGALLGIAVAVAIGYGIYRGGVRINLAKFFKVTGLVLVLIAAGLLATAAHTAHEAGWLNSMQSSVVNLGWLVDRGSVRAAMLTGMFGIQPEPTVAEVLVWFLYLVPFTLIVLWPTKAVQRPDSIPVPAAA